MRRIEKIRGEKTGNGGEMEKTLRFIRGVLLFAAIAGVSGCAPGKVLTLPGDLARSVQKGPAQGTEGSPAVAVLDFTFVGAPSYEIGRDFDHARPIVWKRDPGKAVSDLVADVLIESGVRAVRVSSAPAFPGDAAAMVWGSVDRFRVDARKTGSLKLSVESKASVSVTVYASGGKAPPGWNSVVASEIWTTEPLFITPEGVQDALNRAANAVAEEVVRRLEAAGVILLPPSPAGLSGGEPTAGAGKEQK
jgi:hypothetical protein